MERDKSVVIIYAAGMGKRMIGLGDYTSKCIIDIGNSTPIEHNLKAFARCGIKNFVIVVGYCHERVIDYINNVISPNSLNIKIDFQLNDKYDYHGCEYSIACGFREIADFEDVIITEGDMVLDGNYITEFMKKTNGQNAVLVRDKEYIDDTRSVIACGDLDCVRTFVYDEMHKSAKALIPDNMQVLGDSMQLWRFCGSAMKDLSHYYEEYRIKAEKSRKPLNESGLDYINLIAKQYGLKPIIMSNGDNTINLNTLDDVKKARDAEWIIR